MKAVNNINYIGKTLNKNELEIYDLFENIKTDLIFLLEKPDYKIQELGEIIGKINYIYRNKKTSNKLRFIIKKELDKIFKK